MLGERVNLLLSESTIDIQSNVKCKNFLFLNPICENAYSKQHIFCMLTIYLSWRLLWYFWRNTAITNYISKIFLFWGNFRCKSWLFGIVCVINKLPNTVFISVKNFSNKSHCLEIFYYHCCLHTLIKHHRNLERTKLKALCNLIPSSCIICQKHVCIFMYVKMGKETKNIWLRFWGWLVGPFNSAFGYWKL